MQREGLENRVRARRLQANTFYATLNAAIVGAAALVGERIVIPWYLSAAGILVCMLWFATILNYRTLTDEKRDVICLLEASLPCSPFSAEATRPRFTLIERFIPLAFVLMYIFALLARRG
jgi:hypothetical protein